MNNLKETKGFQRNTQFANKEHTYISHVHKPTLILRSCILFATLTQSLPSSSFAPSLTFLQHKNINTFKLFPFFHFKLTIKAFKRFTSRRMSCSEFSYQAEDFQVPLKLSLPLHAHLDYRVSSWFHLFCNCSHLFYLQKPFGIRHYET